MATDLPISHIFRGVSLLCVVDWIGSQQGSWTDPGVKPTLDLKNVGAYDPENDNLVPQPGTPEWTALEEELYQLMKQRETSQWSRD